MPVLVSKIREHTTTHYPLTLYNPPQASSTPRDLPRPTLLLIKLFYGAAFDTFCQHFVLYLLLCLRFPPLGRPLPLAFIAFPVPPPLKLTARLHRQNKQKLTHSRSSPLFMSLFLFFAVLALSIQITANLIISYANRVCHKRACYGKTDTQAGRQAEGQTGRQSDRQAHKRFYSFLVLILFWLLLNISPETGSS